MKNRPQNLTSSQFPFNVCFDILLSSPKIFKTSCFWSYYYYYYYYYYYCVCYSI